MASTVALVVFWAAPGTQAVLSGQPRVGLGSSYPFAVLAGTTVTNTGPSVISGDVGVSPGSAIVGFPPGHVINGAKHAADAVALQAQNDLTTAYTDAAGRTPVTTIKADLGGMRLAPGVYKTASFMGLTGTVTLDAQNDPNAVFIFQVGSKLTTATSSTVALVRRANPCNVYWQVGSSATLRTDTTFVGTLMALTSASLQTGTSVTGRILARNGAVTLDTNVITRPSCITTTPPSSGPTRTGPTSTGPTSTTSTGPTTTGPTSTSTGPTGAPTTTFGGAGGQGKTPKGHPETGSGGSYRASSSDLVPLGGLALAGAAVASVIAVRRRRAVLAGLGLSDDVPNADE